MKEESLTITVSKPILPGSVFESRIKCGKKYCRCYSNPKNLHTVYQWSGIIDGKNTTRTLTKEMYLECKKRTDNYKEIKAQLKKECLQALKNAPWENKHFKKSKKRQS